jgi:hypothetical protein
MFPLLLPGKDARDPSSERWNCVGEKVTEILLRWLPRHLGIFYMLQDLRRGTDGFTSPPKEGVLRIFLPWNIPTASARNLRTWVLKGSARPLDHPSRFTTVLSSKLNYLHHAYYPNIIKPGRGNHCIFTNEQSTQLNDVWENIRLSSVVYLLTCIIHTPMLHFKSGNSLW